MSIDCYSRNQVYEMGFAVNEYEFPVGEGEFIGALVMKKWNDRLGLTCYFVTDSGEKLKLCVWYRSGENQSYRPRQSEIDMTKQPLHTKWRIRYTESKKGKTVWQTAEILADE